jgi:integrase
MAGLHRLTDRKISSLTKPGRYADGGGLYLVITPSGTRNWSCLFTQYGKRREMGLGPAGPGNMSLRQARAEAEKVRNWVRDGHDPVTRRDAERNVSSQVRTFGDEADAYIAAKQSEWRNAKHRAQWQMTMRVYAGPLRRLPVDAITTEHVLGVLKPIWVEKPETASRVRNRIELILDAARAMGHRSGENPARWRGHMDKLLPKRRLLSRGHFPAMPIDDLPEFMVELRASNGTSARALEFLILTVARTGEVLEARWSEIDLRAAVWTVPAERMKAGRVHRVPLTDDAVAVLRQMQPLRDSDDGFVFPGVRRGRPMSNMAMSKLLKRMGASAYTVHGFRSVFRDWVSERTEFQTELAEQSLAHVLRNRVEAAYRRGDALERRRELMRAWAEFSQSGAPTSANVPPRKLTLPSARETAA